MTGCVFLDRDGVINRDTGYLGRWADFEFLPGVVAALQSLVASGWRIVVVTNQSGIARGYYSLEDYQELTRRMLSSLEASGVPILGVYFCPHHPDGVVHEFVRECDCRKPLPGMIFRAAGDFSIDLRTSVFVGDKLSDMQAAAAAGVGHRYFVEAARNAAELGGVVVDGVFSSLAECVSATDGFKEARV
jgi:D-glycero-D-manno-heptose 1,7-bisphosphate phosphatase